MKTAAILTLLLLAACSEPRLYTGVSIGPGGVSVYPAVSGTVGGAKVTVAP